MLVRPFSLAISINYPFLLKKVNPGDVSKKLGVLDLIVTFFKVLKVVVVSVLSLQKRHGSRVFAKAPIVSKAKDPR